MNNEIEPHAPAAQTEISKLGEADAKIDPDDKYTSVDVGAPIELDILPAGEETAIKNQLEILDDEIADLENKLADMSLPHAFAVAQELFRMHQNDQNFPQEALDKLDDFVRDYEIIADDPASHGKLIREVKMECLLATEQSPYLEVRANTEATDDPTTPCLTFRVWVIGTLLAGAGSFIDTLFSFRQPPITVGANVGQLVAYPAGKFLAWSMPTRKFKLFGREMSLNPGPFNRKEHMLITLMCNVSMTTSYTVDIVPVQYLPMFFNQEFAYKRGYQILNNLGIIFVGYGMAGLTRRFLVWPSFAVWPGTLSNMALIKAFHTETNEPVRGPFGRMWTMSREKFFLITFTVMAVYYFFPGFIFQALSTFSWITWIAPNNVKLNAVCGMTGGMGFNPWPSFDWNIAYAGGYPPLTIPLFTVANVAISSTIGCLIVLAVWFSNKWNTGYLPINLANTWDNTGNLYNVTKVLNSEGRLDPDLYQEYSEPWMTAGSIVAYIFYFVMYSATVVYIGLFYRHELGRAFGSFWRAIRRSLKRGAVSDDEEELDDDIHARLMKQYKDVPEYVYMGVLVVFAAVGMIGVGVYPTQTSPVVMIFGLIMGLITLLPVGIVQAVTGMPVPTNVISEFIGGAFVSGNANALMYYKTYGYMSCYQAMAFSNDLKLAHYSKLPPWHTFTGQMWASFVFSIVSAVVLNFAMGFKGVCTRGASFDFTCPGQEQYFTASVFWGTLSPKRLFGAGKRYNLMLVGFPVGALLVIVYWALRKKYPRWAKLRQIHPVMLCQGPILYPAPYNVSFMLPFLYVTAFSFKYIRPRYTEFWAKYNYVLAASFPTGIAVTAVIIFFGLLIPKGGLAIEWWGNTVTAEGCNGAGGIGCTLLEVPANPGYFGKPPGQFT